MKKLMIVALVTIASITTYADGEEKSVSKLTQAQFENRFKDIAYAGAFEGEVEDLGGACSVTMENKANGDKVIKMVLESGLVLTLSMDAKQVVTATDIYQGDSFSTTYKWKFYSMTHVHVSDAYDTLTLSTGTTKLQCGAYY